MARKSYDFDEEFQGRDRKRDRDSAKEHRRAARKQKVKGQSEWMDAENE